MNDKAIENELENEFIELEKENQEILQRRKERKELFPPITIQEVEKVLGLTIKEDNVNKIITFLSCVTAYTEDSQFNISFNAPSSAGKSYIPLQVSSLFPKEDVIKVGYCSPTAFFHDRGMFNEQLGGYYINLERKIIIFMDQPHNLLLQHLRPFLSHDEKELHLKITDKTQKFGLKTKNVIIRGYPSVIFCSAGLKIDEQEATRFILLSPETTQEKIREGIQEAIKKDSNKEAYFCELNENPQRQCLIQRIQAIKEERIKEIIIHDPEIIEQLFLSENKFLKPRHQRDIKRIMSIVKSHALLNCWYREMADINTIITTDEDIEAGFSIWNEISQSQELNLPPYTYSFHNEIIVPLYKDKQSGLTRKDILLGHLKIYGRPIQEWKLNKEILPMLESAGLIIQEPDPNDKRGKLILPICANE